MSDRDLISAWFHRALRDVDPDAAVRRALRPQDDDLIVDGTAYPMSSYRRVAVLAIGKAAPDMARGCHGILGDRIDIGLIVTKAGHPRPNVPGFRTLFGSHPVPDASSLAAGEAALNIARSLTRDDLQIVLLSGGGSALMDVLADDVSLEDLQATTQLLLQRGATIDDINRFRRQWSMIKGGGLLGHAACLTLALSDVIGSDPATIASGPTVLSTDESSDAECVARQLDIFDALSPGIQRTITTALVRPEPTVVENQFVVIADNQTLVASVQRAALDTGRSAAVLWPNWRGDARGLAHQIVRDTMPSTADIDVMIGGGEATVKMTGHGVGGRNTETALAALLDMPAGHPWTIASLASDGDDGSSRAAGAIVDASMMPGDRERAAAAAALINSDSASWLGQHHALVTTGLTGTNVNDVYIAVRQREA